MHMHNNNKQKSDTFSLIHTLTAFFYLSVKDQTMLQALQSNECPPQHSSKQKSKVFNGIACVFKHISKLNILKIAQVSF